MYRPGSARANEGMRRNGLWTPSARSTFTSASALKLFRPPTRSTHSATDQYILFPVIVILSGRVSWMVEVGEVVGN